MAIDVNEFLGRLPSAEMLSSGNLRALIEVLRTPNVKPHDVVTAVLEIPPALRQAQANARAFEYLQSNYTNPAKPKDFNWLVRSKVGGMRKFDDNRPHTLGAMAWLYGEGVRTIISIEQNNVDRWVNRWTTWFDKTRWFGTFLADWHAPSVAHLHEYCELVHQRRNAGGVATHCWGGTGRTGCFLAAYLVYSEGMPAHRAFTAVRERYNNKSVEMKTQYNALARYADYLQRETSWPVESPLLNHAGGHWDKDYGNAGIAVDPGHKGIHGPEWKPGVNDKVMIAPYGRGTSVPPYVKSDTTMRPQEVARG